MYKNYFLVLLLIFSASSIRTVAYKRVATEQEKQRLEETINHLKAELENNNSYLSNNTTLSNNVILAIKKSNENIQNLIIETKVLLQKLTEQ